MLRSQREGGKSQATQSDRESLFDSPAVERSSVSPAAKGGGEMNSCSAAEGSLPSALRDKGVEEVPATEQAAPIVHSQRFAVEERIALAQESTRDGGLAGAPGKENLERPLEEDGKLSRKAPVGENQGPDQPSQQVSAPSQHPGESCCEHRNVLMLVTWGWTPHTEGLTQPLLPTHPAPLRQASSLELRLRE